MHSVSDRWLRLEECDGLMAVRAFRMEEDLERRPFRSTLCCGWFGHRDKLQEQEDDREYGGKSDTKPEGIEECHLSILACDCLPSPMPLTHSSASF